MRVAWVSPLPPSPSGVGDYSADLLPEVASLVPTVAYTTETAWRPAYPVPGLEIRPHAALEADLAADASLVPVYHQANNPWHLFVHDLAVRLPGVLVLHDVVQHHLLLDRAERTGDWGPYRALLDEQYPDLAEQVVSLRRAKWATELEKFLFPLSGPLARRARLVVVHSAHGRDVLRAEAPDVPVRVIPHHAGQPPPSMPLDRAGVRARLGLGPDDLLFGSFGYITLPKLGHVLLHAFADLVHGGPPGSGATLVFVGGDQQAGEMRRQAASLGIGDRVRFAGYLARDEFYAFLAAVDVSVALRYPSAGETSGTLSRALALGTCLAAVRYGSFSEIPPDACLHVPLHGDDRSTADELTAALRRLAAHPGLRASLGRAAARHAAANLSIAACARRYVEVARAALGAGAATAGA